MLTNSMTFSTTRTDGYCFLLLLLSSILQGMRHVSAQQELLQDVSYACAATGTKICVIPFHSGNLSSCPSSSSALILGEAQIEWLEERGGEFASDKMRILPLHNVTPNASEAADPCTLKQKNIELGIFATQNIVKDTILMRIPRSSLLTAGMWR